MITKDSPIKDENRDTPVENYVRDLLNDETIKITAYARPDRLYLHDCQNGPCSYMLCLEKDAYYTTGIFLDEKDIMRPENKDTIKEMHNGLIEYVNKKMRQKE